jgi:hypothetical protein
MMHRRRFLSLLGMAAPAMALDPERLLWVPGRVAIFDLGVMPARESHMLVTSEWLSRETLRVLQHTLQFAGAMDRLYDERFVQQTVHCARPARFA